MSSDLEFEGLEYQLKISDLRGWATLSHGEGHLRDHQGQEAPWKGPPRSQAARVARRGGGKEGGKPGRRAAGEPGIKEARGPDSHRHLPSLRACLPAWPAWPARLARPPGPRIFLAACMPVRQAVARVPSAQSGPPS